MVDFVLHHTREEEYKCFWVICLNKSTLFTCLLILQFDYSGYLWAVGHLVCVGKSKNIHG